MEEPVLGIGIGPYIPQHWNMQGTRVPTCGASLGALIRIPGPLLTTARYIYTFLLRHHCLELPCVFRIIVLILN